MRVLTAGVNLCDGREAVFLYREPDLPGMAPKYMILPPGDGDAGHMGAMAQYLSLGEDAVVYVHESAHELLGLPELPPGNEDFPFVDDAYRRGVAVELDNRGTIHLTSELKTVHVTIHFVRWLGQHGGWPNALELLGAVQPSEPVVAELIEGFG